MAKYKKGWLSLQSHIDRKLSRETEVCILQLFQYLMNSIFSVNTFNANLSKHVNFIQNQSMNILDLNLKSEYAAERPHRLLSPSPLKRKYGKYQEMAKSGSDL